MTAPKSLAAYRDCEELFERALSRDGAAITLESPEAATRMSHKLNTYRSMLRRQSRTVYPEDHPSYGTSPYDGFQVTKDKENESRLLIKEYRMNILKVEDLP